MAYVVNRYDDTVLTVVDDYTVNNDIDIKLIGRHYIDYGEIQNENMVFLLENFANSSPPPRPLNGQLWYDSFNKKLNIFDEDQTQFVSVNKPTIGNGPPANAENGEFWWDSLNQKLYVFNGIEFVLIGPSENGLIGIGPGGDNPGGVSMDFWWDLDLKQLYVMEDGVDYLVGPTTDDALALAHILS